MGEWALLPDQVYPVPAPPVVAPQLLQPVALDPAERPQEWALLPDVRNVAAVAALVPQLLQPLALDAPEGPREWVVLPSLSSLDPLELVQTYSPGATNANVQPFAGVAPNGVLRCSVVITPGQVMLRHMVCVVCQLGAAGNIAMGVYDRTGVLIGTTGQVPVPGVADVLTIPLTVPVSLVGGRRYYLAVWTSSNGTGFYGLSGIFNGTGPAISFEIPNQTFPLPAGPIALTNKVTSTIFVGGLEQANP